MMDEIAQGVAGSGGRVRRKRFSVQQKQQILRAAFEPGASVARVAREHEVNANQVFKWMKLWERGLLVDRRSQSARLLPVRIAEEPAAAALVTAPATPSGFIRIEIAGKAVLTAEAGADAQLLRTALECLLR